MLEKLQSNWSIIKTNIRNFILFFVGIIVMAIISYIVIFDSHINYLNTQINNNIFEYNEIDREQLCKIAQCIEIEAIGIKKAYNVDNNSHLHLIKYNNYDKIQLHNSLYLVDNQLAIFNDVSNNIFILDTKNIFLDFLNILYYFMPIALLFFSIPLIISIREEKNRSLLELASNEAILSNKSMINIAENIHHELNTPLEVIDNKIEKISRIIEKIILSEKEYIEKLEINDRREKDKILRDLRKDFSFIKTASEQIYTVLSKMKNFKHLRYSNGNKSIKNIIDGGFKIINISNSNFESRVDSELRKYRLEATKLKNANLLSIILNHIKNSLEANASKIFILFVKETKTSVVIRIVDNGNGIPKEVQKDIFKANFSTKENIGSIRGNGMYLNKHILTAAGGYIKLINSSNKGTTIELSIPSEKR